MAMAKRCDRCNAYFQISKNKPNVVAIAYTDYRATAMVPASMAAGRICALSVWMRLMSGLRVQ